MNSYDNATMLAYLSRPTTGQFHVSRLRDQSDPSPTIYPLEVIALEIQRGSSTLHNLHDASVARTIAQATAYALELRKNVGDAAYNEIKRNMPQFMPSLVSESRMLTRDIMFSGLVCLEYDNDDVDTAYAFMLASQNPHVALAWRSLSGKPKILVSVAMQSLDGQPLNSQTFPHAWVSAAHLFEEIGDADIGAMRPTQTQNICHDPDVYTNPTVVPRDWDIDDASLEEYQRQVDAKRKPKLTGKLSGLDAHYLDALAEMQFDSRGISRQMLPCPFSYHEHDDWNAVETALDHTDLQYNSGQNATRVRKHANGDVILNCFKCQTHQRFTSIPPLDELLKRHRDAVERAISKAPPPQDPSRPSYPHFSVEQKRLVRDDGLNPMAGYHEPNGQQIPVWVTKYEKLNGFLGDSNFAMNGQPQETEIHRVWNTTPQTCPNCETPTALYWIDRFRYTTGYYCDNCHKDVSPKNSLLRLELNRKLANHHVSTDKGYVADDPYWNTTPLWEQRRLTFLAAAMNTGKTTYGNDKGIELAQEHNGHFILCVPRVSLAKEQWHKLTQRYGKGSFGLFHENSRKSVGRLGAMCCLSSLPNVFKYEDYETGDTYDPEKAWIFIDEMDYSYQLLNLLSPIAKKAKRYLETALHTNGLVIAGQTEWTAAVEILATELETDQTLGYYKPVKPHKTETEIVVYPNVEGKNAWALSELIEYIQEILDTDKHAYVFCARRRDVSVLYEIFFEHHPLTYTAYSKNTERAERFLEDGKLTDTNIFLATSAAAVGISIIDPKAHTAILGGHIHGHLNCADIVQERVRDRLQNAGRIFLPTYQTAFPVAQTDATSVSRYEAKKKRIAADIDDSDLKNADKLAATYALDSLAEDDPITFITHHLESIAGFDVEVIKPNPPCEHAIQRVRDVTKQTEQDEKSATEKVALDVFDAEIERLKQDAYTPPHLKTTSQARKMSATEYTVLGNKKATELARLIGFDDLSDIDRGTSDDPIPFDWLPKDLELAQQLLQSGVDPSHWKQRFFGYLATRNSVIHDQQWHESLESGNELSAIRDYAFIGELVRWILDTTAGKKYDTQSLTADLTRILNTRTENEERTYLDEIQSGAIGVKTWRKARYLNISISPIEFCIELTETFYPCIWKKYRDQVSIHNDEKLDLFEKALNTFLYHQRSPEMRDLDAAFGGTDKIVDVKPFPETEDPENRFYANVRKLFTDGNSVDEIIEITGLGKAKIYDVIKDLRVPTKKKKDMPLQKEALELLDSGMSKRAVAEKMKMSRTKLNRILSL